MDRNDVTWKGYWAACPTPFHADGSYDADLHRALLDWYAGQGLHGVLVNGTTGEWFSQTPEERKLVAATAIDAVAMSPCTPPASFIFRAGDPVISTAS